MSRPFSYNDKNCTVIGNILFVYFQSDDFFVAGDPRIEIPPEILKTSI